MATYNDGDMLVDNKTWNVYQRTNGSWSLMGNIKGEKGDNGTPGNQLLIYLVLLKQVVNFIICIGQLQK